MSIDKTYTTKVILSANNQGVVVSGISSTMKQVTTVSYLTGPQGEEGPQGPQGTPGATGGIVPITVSTTPPPTPAVGDFWFDIS